MAKLGAQATVRARGERSALAGFTDPIENRGYAVWYAVRSGKARTQGIPGPGPSEYGMAETQGLLVEVNLSRKMDELWSELRSIDPGARESFKSEVRTYLRASRNMICLRSPGLGPGEHGQPLWWIRDTWNDVRAVGIFKQTELTRAEKRVTPEEAGETLPPAPVEVRKATDAEADSAELTTRDKRIKALEDARAQRDSKYATERAARIAAIHGVLKSAEYPIYLVEISERAGFAEHLIERIVRDEVEAGRIFRRLETKDEREGGKFGRFHHLYWLSDPVPVRPTGTYRATAGALEKLQNGQTLLMRALGKNMQKEIREMAEVGLVVITSDGDDERVRLAEEKPAPEKQPEQAPSALLGVVSPRPPEFTAERTVTIPELSPETPEETRVAMGGQTDLQIGLEQLVEAEVRRRMAGRSVSLDEFERVREDLQRETQRRQRAESALIEARTELSAAKQEAERLTEVEAQLAAIRQVFGK
jgi:hypothetical protein